MVFANTRDIVLAYVCVATNEHFMRGINLNDLPAREQFGMNLMTVMSVRSAKLHKIVICTALSFARMMALGQALPSYTEVRGEAQSNNGPLSEWNKSGTSLVGHSYAGFGGFCNGTAISDSYGSLHVDVNVGTSSGPIDGTTNFMTGGSGAEASSAVHFFVEADTLPTGTVVGVALGATFRWSPYQNERGFLDTIASTSIRNDQGPVFPPSDLYFNVGDAHSAYKQAATFLVVGENYELGNSLTAQAGAASEEVFPNYLGGISAVRAGLEVSIHCTDPRVRIRSDRGFDYDRTLLSGNCVLQNYVGSYENRIAHMVLRDDFGNLIDEWDQPLNPGGQFDHIARVKLHSNETYGLLASVDGWLFKRTHFPATNASSILVSMVNGDCDRDNYVGTDDYLILNTSFDLSPADSAFDVRADLSGDAYVGTDDYLILNSSFDTHGDQ